MEEARCLKVKINTKFIVNSANLLVWVDAKAGIIYRTTLLTRIIHYSIYSNNWYTNATIIYQHVVSLLHVSAFFGHPQGGIKQRKIQWWIYLYFMCNDRVKIQMLPWIKKFETHSKMCIRAVFIWMANKYLLQKIIVVSKYIFLCLLWLFISPQLNALNCGNNFRRNFVMFRPSTS